MKALERDRENRHADASALADDLRAVARELGWDTEKAALAQLVKAALPDDQVAFGQIGSDAGPTRTPPQRRATTTGSWTDADSFASLEVIDPTKRRGIGVSYWWARETLVAVAIMTLLSAVFWLWIVPRVVP
jgi:hypothetical protein